jgi:hypothetical protein
MATTVRSSSIGTAASGTAVSVAAPAGTTTGDLVVVVVHCNNLTTIVDNNGATPFTEDLNDRQNAATSQTVSLFTRRILGGDPSTYNFTLGASNRWTAVAVAFQSPHASVIFDAAISTADAANGTGSFNVPSVNTATTEAIHCSVFCADVAGNSITGTPAGYTVQQNGGDQDIAFATKVISVPGATGTTNWTDALDDGKIGISFAIRDINGVTLSGSYPLTGADAATLEARLNNFRLAQSRLGFMNPALRLTINGTARQSVIEKTSLRISLSLESPATCTLTTKWNPGFVPIEGQELKVGVGAITNLLFAGHITDVKQIHDERGRQVRYSLSCQDYTWLLDRRQVLRHYTGDNVESIIADVISTFTSGFTTHHVNQGLKYLAGGVTFTMETPSGCLRRMAQEAGAYAYVDFVKDVHLFAAGGDRVPQPHDLSASYKDFEHVAYSVDLSQIRTRVHVEGAGNQLAAQYNLNGTLLLNETSAFPATETDVRLGEYAPVNGRRFRWTKSGGTTLGASGLGDENHADYIAMAPFPISTAVNIWVIADDTAAQTALAALEGGDGIHEHYVQDRRLSFQGATDRATAELARYANPLERLTYRTHDPNTRPGARVTVNLAAPASITGTFTIQSVTIGDVETAAYRHPWYDVVATSSHRTLWDVYRDVLETKAA